MTFQFDDRFSMFDVTPVENQFILEYLPTAKGEFIKVYLYGLLFCYHPEENMTVEQMSHDLGISTEEIEAAFRYWERRGVVYRLSDRPPSWSYVNWKQRNSSDRVSPQSEAFIESVYSVFDHSRRLHVNELQICREWVEDLHLAPEAVIMLMKHMMLVKGKNFSFQAANQVAVQMAEEHIQTLEDAEEFLSRDRTVYDNVKKILRKLGKRGMPSEGQVNMYRKWVRDWHFTAEAIEAACEETAKGEPTMGYLDGILNRMRTQVSSPDTTIEAQDISQSMEEAERLKRVLSILGHGTLNDANRQLFREMEALYPQDIILIAAQECARRGNSMEDLRKLLESWKSRGLETQEEVRLYITGFNRENSLLKELQLVWGKGEPRLGESNRKLVRKWTSDWMFDETVILKCAEYAQEARSPMLYLDRLLQTCREKGIQSVQDVEADHQRFLSERTAEQGSAGKRSVTAQQYEQREYERNPESLDQMVQRLKGEMTDA